MNARKVGITSKDGTENLIRALTAAKDEAREEAHKHAYWAIRVPSGIQGKDDITSREQALQFIAVERVLSALIAALDGEWEANRVDPYLSIKETLEP
jgi:hypothetical protein